MASPGVDATPGTITIGLATTGVGSGKGRATSRCCDGGTGTRLGALVRGGRVALGRGDGFMIGAFASGPAMTLGT